MPTSAATRGADIVGDLDGITHALPALDEAIAWTWRQLVEAGATNRTAARGAAVSAIDSDGWESEDEIRRLWRDVREMGARRKVMRLEVRKLTAELSAMETAATVADVETVAPELPAPVLAPAPI